jgi:hypothetical protein
MTDSKAKPAVKGGRSLAWASPKAKRDAALKAALKAR